MPKISPRLHAELAEDVPYIRYGCYCKAEKKTQKYDQNEDVWEKYQSAHRANVWNLELAGTYTTD